jgi:perosamine synthetase
MISDLAVESALERISERETRYVHEVLADEFRTSSGSTMTSRLEERFSALYGMPYAISFVNGTATLHATLAAAGIGPGDEVIVPPLTMASTTFAVLHAGARPVFADVDRATWTLDPQSVEHAITERTKAVVPVALFGLPPDMQVLTALTRERRIFLLEDAAQCILGRCDGQLVGTFGDAASFSFQSSKHLTSGEGGIILGRDRDMADRIRRFGSLGYAGVGAGTGKISRTTIQNPDYARHVSVGFNYRMPELCAAVALAQVERAELLVAARRRAASRFAEVVAGAHWLVPQFVPSTHTHTYWTYALRIDRSDIAWQDFRDRFVAHGGDGIYAAWRLTYDEPFFADVVAAGLADRANPCPTATALQPRLLQFKTNYWREDELEGQLRALRQTIDDFT